MLALLERVEFKFLFNIVDILINVINDYYTNDFDTKTHIL